MIIVSLRRCYLYYVFAQYLPLLLTHTDFTVVQKHKGSRERIVHSLTPLLAALVYYYYYYYEDTCPLLSSQLVRNEKSMQ